MILQVTVLSLSPRWPGGEGRVRGADERSRGATHLTLPSLRDGPLLSPLKGAEGLRSRLSPGADH